MPAFEESDLPGRKRTVLVVEDNELNRDLLEALLEDKYRVLEAENGQEGIELMREHYEEISLVLLDVFMPVMNGFEFLRLRFNDARLLNIPVIVTTASESLDDEIRCLQLGANDFVSKPYNHEILINRVGNTIRLRESASIVNQLRWDATTGLYRGDFFYRRVDNLLAAYPSRSFDMVCSDIRNFKMLNERYGRESCDMLLLDLATKFQAAIPGVIASGRTGGDSFGFLIEHQDSDWSDAVADVVSSINIAHLYVRFGIVEDVDHSTPATQLVNQASIAIEELRDSVGVGLQRYDDVLRQRREMERVLVESMHDGLKERQFMVYYQPKHDVVTSEVAGAEALVRWLHPELGFVRPEVFITLFERNGMIRELDRYVCEEVCREIARLKSLELRTVPISINISPLDFDDRDLPQRVLELADKYGVDHSLLHLELTETAYAEDPDVVVSALKELRSYGFKIELDDFGSGYSSLALLSIMPIDILKIDGGMVKQASRTDDFRIIQSSIQMAQLLGFETVIEGVETLAAMDRLRALGCDMVQGFYYSWPLREDDFEYYLREH